MAFTTFTKGINELTTAFQTPHTVSSSATSASLTSLNVINSGPITASNQSTMTTPQLYLGAQLVDDDDAENGYTHPISIRMDDGTRIILNMDNSGEMAVFYVQAVWDDTTNNMMRCGAPVPQHFETTRVSFPSEDFALGYISPTRFAVHVYNEGTSVWSYDPTTKAIRRLTQTAVNGTWGSANRVDYAPVDSTSFLVAGDTGSQYNISRLTFDGDGVITIQSVLTNAATNSYITLCKAHPTNDEYAYAYYSGSGNIWNTVRADFNTGTDVMTTVTSDTVNTGASNFNYTCKMLPLNQDGASYGVALMYVTATGAIQATHYASDTASATTATTPSTFSSFSRANILDAGTGQIVYKPTAVGGGNFYPVFRYASSTLSVFEVPTPNIVDRYHSFAFDSRVYTADWAVSQLDVLSGGSTTKTNNHLMAYGHSNGKRFTWNNDADKYICVRTGHIWVLDSEFNIIADASFGGSYPYCEAFDVVSDDPTSIVALTTSTTPRHYNTTTTNKYIQRITLPTAIGGSASAQWSILLDVTGSPPNNWSAAVLGGDILSYGGNLWVVGTFGVTGSTYYFGIYSGDNTFTYYDYHQGQSVTNTSGRWGSDTLSLIKYTDSTYDILAAMSYSSSRNGYVYRYGPATFTGTGTTFSNTGYTSANFAGADNWGGIYSYRTSSKRHGMAGWLGATALDGSPLRVNGTSGDPWIAEVFWYGDTSYLAHGASSSWALYANNTSVGVDYSGSTNYLWGRAQVGSDAFGGFWADEDSATKADFYSDKTVSFTINLHLNGGTEEIPYVETFNVAPGVTVELSNPIVLEGDDYFQIKASSGNYLQASVSVIELS